MKKTTHAPKPGLPRVSSDSSGSRIAVIGGGIAGVAAATVLAEHGASVVLFEREAQLGGRVRGWPDQLSDGSGFTMERGFHAFFRNYYNLRALLRRVDPGLTLLEPLEDYPLLGPNGHHESYAGLPRQTPLNLLALIARTRTLGIRDLPAIPSWPTLAMLAYDESATFSEFDGISAGEFLDSLNFPVGARRMLFDIFAHSFFNPERVMSAAEMIRLFHVYFTGNPEGLVFDVLRVPFADVWCRFEALLHRNGADVRLATAVTAIGDAAAGGVRVKTAAGDDEFASVVLACEVPGLQALSRAGSGRIGAALSDVASRVGTTAPFAVWRLWLDRPTAPGRAPFAAVGGLGRLDNISLYHLFQDDGRAFSARTGGSVVELHAYALEGMDAPDAEAQLRAELHATLEELYPEIAGATVLDERWILAADCPAFEVGAWQSRPTTTTTDPRLVLAGDHVRLPVPAALMEGAATSGFLAANSLLRYLGVAGVAVDSVPLRGILSGAAAFCRRANVGPFRSKAA